MIKELILGNKRFPVNLIAAPLAGYTCAAFRALIWEYSHPAFSCSEMISCKALLHKPLIVQKRYLEKNPNEGPVCFQLFGSEPKDLAIATKIVTDCGADLVDLNCGCPVSKVRKQAAGSSLLMDLPNLAEMIQAMKNNTHLPISIKIRVEGQKEKFNYEIVRMLQDSGVDFIVVHGRHWTEHYNVPCDHAAIQFFAENLKIPVIGNGDVSDLISLRKMLATGCAGVMIGRAIIGQPWLIGKLIAEMRGETFNLPSNKEIGLMFIKHITDLARSLEHEKTAIAQARKMSGYYAKRLSGKKELVCAINTCETLADFQRICSHYFI